MMPYKQLVEKGYKKLVQEQLDKGRTYSQATLIVKKRLSSAISEAEEDARYHEVNAGAWGDGDGTPSLKEEYGSYDGIRREISEAQSAANTLREYKAVLQTDYKNRNLQTIQEFPKRGHKESDEDYAKKLEVYAENVADIQKEAEEVSKWKGRATTLQAQGYDDECKSDYKRFIRDLADCIEALDNLPYSDLACAQEILQECAYGLKKAEEKKAELQGTLGSN